MSHIDLVPKVMPLKLFLEFFSALMWYLLKRTAQHAISPSTKILTDRG